eukprot:6353933-Amphidinium_carterae.2
MAIHRMVLRSVPHLSKREQWLLTNARHPKNNQLDLSLARLLCRQSYKYVTQTSMSEYHATTQPLESRMHSAEALYKLHGMPKSEPCY